MKHFAIAMAVAATVAAAAAPALAQSYGYQGGYDQQRGYDQERRGDDGRWSGRDQGYRGDIRVDSHLTSGYVDGLFWKLDNAVNEGRLAPGRAQQLKRELRQVQELAYPVETGQASRWERQQLSQTVAKIDSALLERGRYRAGGYRR